MQQLLAWLGASGPALPEPRVEDFALPAARVPAPPALASICSDSAYDRLTHCGGQSFADTARMWARSAQRAPDWVAYPDSEAQIADLLDWASRRRIAVVPFGGGTSVVGGVEPIADSHYAASVALDLERFDRVLEIDGSSRAARIQAGVLGPDLEAQLRAHDLTLRHFPQSFQFSTLGGWIATRAGGHYATLATHIDDFVESTRLVTPAGTIATRRLPASGAGPAPDQLVLGSEGTLGVITEAWMRLQQRPRFRASASVQFADMGAAVSAVRALAQSGLYPSNCRLLDPAEVAFAGVGDRRSPTLVLGFESADHAIEPWMARALELSADHGGRQATGADDKREDAAATWRNAFLRMPYLRDEATRRGAILDTFESAVTWDRFDAFYAGVREDVGAAIERITGSEAPLSCRFTHVYPDGPAPYFTYAAVGSIDGDLASAAAKWREIKQATNAAVIRHGGTSTHHHAVGRDHRDAYEQEVPALMRAALGGAKRVLDPAGVMNPGVLLAPAR
ncbi:MAG TPA: FAD-binding oxidoreductase [Burkholderiaceae bacterium]|nr:FAD-binding oxidoreductase [Burkholderiaceae bacterium]